MQLQTVDKVEEISPEDFKKNYYNPKKPLIITGMAKQWPAYNKRAGIKSNTLLTKRR